MKDTKVERARRNAAMLRRQFLHGDGGLFDQVLDDQTLATVFAAHGKPGRDRVYPPQDTLRLFIGQVLGQVLSADRACQDVVGRRLSERLAHGQPASALNTGSYCDARSRLPLALPTTLSSLIGERLESAVPLQWRWQGRTVKLFDGTTVSMPDTPDNQQAWPQSREQKPGLGFPVARIGALIGLASGAVLRYQVAACEGKGTGEQSLLQNLLVHLKCGRCLTGRCAARHLVDRRGRAPSRCRCGDGAARQAHHRLYAWQPPGQKRSYRAVAAPAQDDERGRLRALSGVHYDARA